MKSALFIALFTMLLSPTVFGQGAASTLSGPTITVDQATLQKMIRDEVEKQLPDAVSKEIARQIELEKEKSRQERMGDVLLSYLQVIRSQLELYKVQHRDVAPPLAGMVDWSILTKATKEDGSIVVDGPYGPYVQQPPANPATGKTKVVAKGKADETAGWTYDEKTGEVRAVL